MTGELQRVPVRIYDRDKHIVLAAPLPGLEAENSSPNLAAFAPLREIF